MSNLAKGLKDESTREVISIISAREIPPLSSATTLCGTNAECDCINFERLTHLPGSIHVHVAKGRGDQRCLERWCSVRERFSLFCKDKGKRYTDLNIRVNAYFLILYCSGTNHGNIIIKVIYMNEYHTGKAIEILTIPDFMRGLR